jgi:hypothetical protein
MKRLLLFPVLALALCASAGSQDPTPAPPVPVVVPTPDPISVPLVAVEAPATSQGAFMVVLHYGKHGEHQVTAKDVTWANSLPKEPSTRFRTDVGDEVLFFHDPVVGEYVIAGRVQVETPGRDPVEDFRTIVKVGHAPQPPPGPEPEPPGPTPPVTEGARHVVIVYETADVTPAFARLLNGLRSGTNAKYLADHKHRLDLIDDDAVTADGAKAALLEKYAPSAKFPRSLIVADAASGAVVAVGELTDASTAAGVIEFIKQNGG